MGFLLVNDIFSYGQRSKCADLLNSYLDSNFADNIREHNLWEDMNTDRGTADGEENVRLYI
jgi:hypothetical protein